MNKHIVTIFGLAVGVSGCSDEPTGPRCGEDTCDINARCGADTTGTPLCVCDPGFTGDGLVCDEAYAPLTCAEVKANNPAAVDGSTQLYVGGDFNQPWTAYCHDMAGTPTEYLELAQLGTSNFSEFVEATERNATPGIQSDEIDHVRIAYHRVRIDPHSLVVDLDDQLFLWEPGHQGGPVESAIVDEPNLLEITSMPFGVAMYCGPQDDAATAVARANIDLRGTPFRVLSELCATGPATDIDIEGQIVDLRVTGADGVCGWAMVDPCPSQAVNADARGASLRLQYSPVTESP